MASEHVVPAGGVEKEPLIPYVAEKDYPEHLRPVLEPYSKRMGFIPNALKLYMHRPEIAETLWKLNSNIMRDPSSTLDQGLKRRVSAICSKTNGCTYCSAHCCDMLKKPAGGESEGWGMARDEVMDLVRGDLAPADERERACFDFARAASADPAAVPDEILERLKAYLTPPQVVELACVVGFWKMYNTIHDALRIPIEAHLEHDTDFVHA
jgi:uncharacterized peroxidase-related enzyme